MSPAQFVTALKQVVYKGAASGTLEVLRKPPGRGPDQALAQLSNWFGGLNSEDQARVAKVIDVAAKEALYNVLLVLDGLLAIESAGPKSEVCLEIADGITRQRMNDPDSQQLSALFKEMDRSN